MVQERLFAVSLYLDGIKRRDIEIILGRGQSYIGHWIRAYFKDGVEGLIERRGGDRKSLLSQEKRASLKTLITTTQPMEHDYAHKGWDGKIIRDLISKKYQVEYTVHGVYKLLERLNITHKLAMKVDPKKSQEKIDKWKEESKKI